MHDELEFSDDPARLDHARIHAWLSEESYWATARPRAVQEAAIDGSRNFGVYARASGEQLAYARVVTDGVTFAWLCDVFVSSDARGRGIGIALIDGVVAALEPLGLKRILLATGDAHGLYSRFGFQPLARPQDWMEYHGPGRAG